MGQFPPASGLGGAIATGIFQFLETSNINTDNIAAIGCDSIAINTGQKGRVFRTV